MKSAVLRQAGLVAAVYFTAIITALAIVVNARLYTASPLERGDTEITEDALPRLKYLKKQLQNGGGEQMQKLFPEGYFFTHVLYGITWVDISNRENYQAHRPSGIPEIYWALQQLESAAGRAPFPANASPNYGVFYAGWTLWLRAGLTKLTMSRSDLSPEIEKLRTDANALAAAFDNSATPFLSAYPGQSWPVDSVVAIAALKMAGTVLETNSYQKTITEWLSKAKQLRDPKTQLLPHQTDPETGAALVGARGSSQALLLRFLNEIDSKWAQKDYRRFINLFTSHIPGIPGIREFPAGNNSKGDVDSGPLVYGISSSTTVVALGTAVVFGDRRTASRLTGLMEAVGAPIQLAGQRFYLGGVLPVADAFVAWVMTARPWLTQPVQPTKEHFDWWRMPWHLITVGALTPLWLLIVRVRRWANAPARYFDAPQVQ